MKTKLCIICKVPKPLDDFWRQKSARDGHLPYCKPCDRERKKKYAQTPQGKASQKAASSRWRKTPSGKAKTSEATKRYRRNNPLRFQIKDRRSDLKFNHNITVEEYDEKLIAQDGRCAICNVPVSERKALAVDHNHTTGANRDLLCELCNRGLGMFRDSREILLAAIAYLDKWK